MKIALFVGGMWRGGVTTFVLDLGPFLQQAGHTVEVIAPEQGEWWSRLAEVGLSGVWLPPQTWESRIAYAKRLANYLVQEGFDALLINNGIGGQPAQLCLPYLPEKIAALVLLHSNVPRVHRAAQINREAWQVAVVASPQVQQIAREHLPGKKIQIIPYGIEIPDETALTRRAPWELPLRLLFAGTLDHYLKGVFLLPQIVAACEENDTPVRMTIVGEGGDEKRLRELIGDSGVADRIQLLGALPRAQVLQAMQKHHILVMPSHFEGLPLVSLEAQAAGCVPVASRLEGIMDFAVEEGVSGYLATVDDAQDFARQIAMLADAERWRAASQAAIARAQQHFSVSVMGESYLALLEQVAAGTYPLPQARKPPGASAFFHTPQDYLPGALRSALGRYGYRVRKWMRRAKH